MPFTFCGRREYMYVCILAGRCARSSGPVLRCRVFRSRAAISGRPLPSVMETLYGTGKKRTENNRLNGRKTKRGINK